nr:hypothetical protein [Actinoplanes sp. N902-109]
MQPLTLSGFAGIRMGAGIGELVAVGRPSTQVPAFQLGLRLHGRPDANLDAVSLAFTHAAVERHDQIMRVGAGVDSAADLGHPQTDAVVHEHGEGHAELAAVERALRLADDDGVEVAAGAFDGVEQPERFRAPLPRQGT